jgi:hypothetical protein
MLRQEQAASVLLRSADDVARASGGNVVARAADGGTRAGGGDVIVQAVDRGRGNVWRWQCFPSGWQVKDEVVKMSPHGWRTRRLEQVEVMLLHGRWA